MVRILTMIALLIAALAPIVAAEEAPRRPVAEETARWKSEIAKLLKQLPDNYPRLDDKEVEAPAAAVALRALDDPAVVPAVAALLTTERRARARMLLVEVAAKFKTDASLALMVKVAITDEDKHVRKAALATWKDYQRVEQILALLPPYIESEKLRYIALDALEKSGIQISPGQPQDKVLVKTLIKHLYRKESQVQEVVVSSELFTPNNGYHSRNTRGLVKIEKVIPDVVVLQTLKRITGQDYGYNVENWSKYTNSQRGK